MQTREAAAEECSEQDHALEEERAHLQQEGALGEEPVRSAQEDAQEGGQEEKGEAMLKPFEEWED